MKCRKTIKGKKVWIDNNNEENTRPSNIEVNLLRNNIVYKSLTIPSLGDSAYAFDCLPVYDKQARAYNYKIDEITPEGYNKTINNYNITNTLIEVNVKYVFNNIVHNDYTGTVYTEVDYSYPIIKPVTIKEHLDVFTEYTEECEFVGWNTAPNGNGSYYYPNTSFMFTENITLYAIWRSCKPLINTVYVSSSLVSGLGVVSMGNIYSRITVTILGIPTVTYTRDNNSYSVPVPDYLRPLSAGTPVSVIQRETGKLASEPQITYVIRN